MRIVQCQLHFFLSVIALTVAACLPRVNGEPTDGGAPFDKGIDAGMVPDSGSDAGNALDGGFPDAGSTDGGLCRTGQPPIATAALKMASVDRLRHFFGTQTGFDNGQVYFRDAIGGIPGCPLFDFAAVLYVSDIDSSQVPPEA